jgi:proteic killer suppression protein
LWKAHQLTGDRKGVWSLHVTRNWRLTFEVKGDEIVDVNYEDYH